MPVHLTANRIKKDRTHGKNRRFRTAKLGFGVPGMSSKCPQASWVGRFGVLGEELKSYRVEVVEVVTRRRPNTSRLGGDHVYISWPQDTFNLAKA